MKKNFIYLLFFIFASCSGKRDNAIYRSANKKEVTKAVLSDSVQLIVSSTNLSEDMSSLSSNDDEVAVFIYNYSDSAITSKPVFSDYFILNKNKMSYTIQYTDKITELNNNVIFFLLEVDSEKKLREIESEVRKNYKELINAYYKKDYTEIEKYIGDDDLMGIKKIENIDLTDR
jgi:hypothetical protein